MHQEAMITHYNGIARTSRDTGYPCIYIYKAASLETLRKDDVSSSILAMIRLNPFDNWLQGVQPITSAGIARANHGIYRCCGLIADGHLQF